MKANLIEAKYIKGAKSVLLLLQKDEVQQRLQVHRRELASFGDRNEAEIVEAMQGYVDTLNKIYKGKEIELERGNEE
jgi:hypothetical protein